MNKYFWEGFSFGVLFSVVLMSILYYEPFKKKDVWTEGNTLYKINDTTLMSREYMLEKIAEIQARELPKAQAAFAKQVDSNWSPEEMAEKWNDFANDWMIKAIAK